SGDQLVPAAARRWDTGTGFLGQVGEDALQTSVEPLVAEVQIDHFVGNPGSRVPAAAGARRGIGRRAAVSTGRLGPTTRSCPQVRVGFRSLGVVPDPGSHHDATPLLREIMFTTAPGPPRAAILLGLPRLTKNRAEIYGTPRARAPGSPRPALGLRPG